ncbi:co-chaperone GroES [bacterium]|nr:co-chaperone GroES [bacterium]MCI0566203.1 co-chaperone GroES [bacterium]
MATEQKITPLGDRVLVKTLSDAETEKRTETGIIIPDTVDKERPQEGKVIAVGEGRETDEGRIIKPKVKVGDRVIFSKYGPDEIKVDDEEYYILSESQILAVVK